MASSQRKINCIISYVLFSHLILSASSFANTQRRRTHSIINANPSQLRIHKAILNLSQENSQDERNNTPYRSIGEVVGGLHGGKYQFDSFANPAAAAYYNEQSFGGQGSTTCYEDNNEETERPNWFQQMRPPSTLGGEVETLTVPSNANPMDGMIYSTTITIKNDERTWEKFYAKIMMQEGETRVDNEQNDQQSFPFYVRPSSGDLAPRGGGSNACDEMNPYSDSATLRIIHNPKNDINSTPGCQWWLLVGTEEEKWFYKVQLENTN